MAGGCLQNTTFFLRRKIVGGLCEFWKGKERGAGGGYPDAVSFSSEYRLELQVVPACSALGKGREKLGDFASLGDLELPGPALGCGWMISLRKEGKGARELLRLERNANP